MLDISNDYGPASGGHPRRKEYTSETAIPCLIFFHFFKRSLLDKICKPVGSLGWSFLESEVPVICKPLPLILSKKIHFILVDSLCLPS